MARPLHFQIRLNERADPVARLGQLDNSGAGPSAGARSPVPAFRTVYREYFNFVWSLARRLGVEPEAMDDLVQEVFIVIHAKLDSLERPEALRSWIYSIVRRTVSTHRRAKRVQTAHRGVAIAAGDVASHEPTPLEHTEKRAALDLLARLLAELDEPKRELFALVELEELTVPEAAETLDIPLNTAYSRLRAARQAFEAALARHEARSQHARSQHR